MQIGILEGKDFSKNALITLSRIADVEIYENIEINLFLENKEVLFIRLEYFIDRLLLDKAKKLKYICTPTTGLNHINLALCQERGIQVISLKGEYEFLETIRATPEHTFGLVLSLLRNYKKAFLNKDNTDWDREKYKGFEIYQNKVGIIGLGRVGKILAKYFNAFDADVYFYDIDKLIDSKNATKTFSMDELIKKTNIVILSASYTEKNYHFFDKDSIDLLKGKYFINTARGELLNEEYLIEKLKDNYFKGVALDVIHNEQLDNNLKQLVKLTTDNNLILTAHIAGATYTSMHRTEEFIVEKLINNLG